MTWRDPASLQEYGQQQYQAGNHSVALEAFDKALRLNLPGTVGILDNRAATFLKLGRLEPALRDGRKMIKTDARDGRGYLRCGKVLQLMGKPDKALEIYTYGLKVLPSDHPSRNLIVQLKDKVHMKMQGPRLIDPFEKLPPEIICMILEYFSFKQLVGILRVSRGWENYLCSLQNLWTHLDLSGALDWRSGPSPRRLTMSALRRYTGRSKSRLTHATLYHIPESVYEKALEHISRYPHLSYLNIRDDVSRIDVSRVLRPSVNLTTLKISRSTELSPPVLFRLLHSFPRIEYLEARVLSAPGINHDWPDRMPNLRTIILVESPRGSFQRTVFIPGLSDGTVSEHLPELEELCLIDILPQGMSSPRFSLSSLSSFRSLHLGGIDTLAFPILPSSLEQLYISGSTKAITQYFPYVETSSGFTKLPNLKSLTLTKTKFVDLEFLESMFEETEMELTFLDLSGSLKIDGRDVGKLMLTKHLESVEELNISYVANVTDVLSSMIIEHMPNLKVLNVNQTQITGLFVKDLVDSEDVPLERLFTEKCGNLGADAIAYARARGVDVVSVVRG
ncbi:hypothetical protein FQN54_005504 [Arachnomyces sp. PD_36]|nr:hypothetical protein FQN54_005504 [Arachnomyces sp. PD_36]